MLAVHGRPNTMTTEDLDTEVGTPDDSGQPMLSSVEARVLGVLMEKQKTTPDYYPLTLNALVQGCNQKTSRDPVMSLSAGEVGHIVNRLRDRELVRASLFSRAERYEHRLSRALGLGEQEQAALCVLMLRGPQTAGELRTNSGRMAEFTDLGAVSDTLELLIAREPPLVVRLPRVAGRREERFAHLLCGEVTVDEEAVGSAGARLGGGDARISELEQQVAELRQELDSLWRLTGLEPTGSDSQQES
jgi:uncharacterized protein YceH (UPF0502 family)